MASSKSLVRLNIGGVWYTTTRATLLRHQDSLLSAMLQSECKTTDSDADRDANQAGNRLYENGLHSDKDNSTTDSKHQAIDGSGYFFIDRDGELFRYILNYLRSDELLLPSNFTDHEQLLAESAFYRLPSLTASLQERFRGPKSFHFVEIVEVCHPEKTGLCGTRVVLDEATLSTQPFNDAMATHYDDSECHHGDCGRSWIRSSLGRLSWCELLKKHGWSYEGNISFSRKIPDVTGRGTDMVHVVEKWCKSFPRK